jgi:hypothetical protein
MQHSVIGVRQWRCPLSEAAADGPKQQSSMVQLQSPRRGCRPALRERDRRCLCGAQPGAELENFSERLQAAIAEGGRVAAAAGALPVTPLSTGVPVAPVAAPAPTPALTPAPAAASAAAAQQLLFQSFPNLTPQQQAQTMAMLQQRMAAAGAPPPAQLTGAQAAQARALRCLPGTSSALGSCTY